MKRALGVIAFLIAALLLSVPTYPAEELAREERAEATPVATPPPLTPEPERDSIICPTAEPTEEPPPPSISRYAEIEITEEDIETLARLVWLEARGEPFEGQVAVVEVVLNRILSPSFPDTVEAVVYQKNQFSPAAYIPETTPTETQYRAVAAAIEGSDPITDADVVYFSVGAYNERVYTTIGNHIFCRE